MHTFKVTRTQMFLDDLQIIGCSGFKVISKASEDHPTVILEIDCENVVIEELSNP